MVFAGLFDKFCAPSAIAGMTRLLESRVPERLSLLEPLLSYYTPKFIKIDYWPIAFLNLCLKLVILFYVLGSLFFFSDRAAFWRETPMGTVNAFAGADYTTSPNVSAWMKEVQKPESELSYCNNESHAFKSSAAFDYEKPECQFVVPEELVQKGKGQVQVATVFLENECGSPLAAHL